MAGAPTAFLDYKQDRHTQGLVEKMLEGTWVLCDLWTCHSSPRLPTYTQVRSKLLSCNPLLMDEGKKEEING